MAGGPDGYTRIPNTLLEALARAGLNATQLSICLFILRRTSGWGREEDSITLREFAAACGSDETYIFKQLQELVRRRVITRSPGRPARYALQSNPAQWLCLPGEDNLSKRTSKTANLSEKTSNNTAHNLSDQTNNPANLSKRTSNDGEDNLSKKTSNPPNLSKKTSNDSQDNLSERTNKTANLSERTSNQGEDNLSKRTSSAGTSALEPQGFAPRLKKDLDLDVIDDVDIDRARENLPVVRIQEALQQAGILAPSPLQVEKLTAWLAAGLELAVVLWAVEKAALANVRRVDYIDAICRNLYNAGVRTLEQARAETARYEALRCAAARQRTGSRRESGSAPPPGKAAAADREQAAARERKRRLIESLYFN